MTLVPGRECGGCTICCSELHIDAPELKKLAGVRCPNCLPNNDCAIYETRPKVCREFHCVWRQLALLDDDWRPDRSGILLTSRVTGVPPAYRGLTGVQILLARPDAIYKREFLGLVASWVNARVPIFLTIPAPKGFVAPNTFMNIALEDYARRQDGDGLLREMNAAIQNLVRQRPSPMVFRSPEAT